jgi:hypothetical protein
LRRFRLALGDKFVESELESRVSSAGMVSILLGVLAINRVRLSEVAAPAARAVRAGG